MNKYLIFRTDRIGDFLISLILIKSIKMVDSKSLITVVASEKNYQYIKSFNIIDEVILLKGGFFNKLKLFFLLRKQSFDTTIVHDGKTRSKFISFFLSSKNKYFSNINKFSSYIDEIRYILKNLKITFNDNFLDILNDRDYSKIYTPKKPYILIHFDEKWIFDQYIKTYSNIEPSLKELETFLTSLTERVNKKIIITTGVNTPKILKNFFENNSDGNIILLENLNFFHLESIIVNASLLISCHGAVSHVAAAKSIEQIDVIDKSYNYSKWSKHFRNYKSIERKNFDSLYKDILNSLL